MVHSMRRFLVKRTEDVSGVSGIGKIAEGIEFSSGLCVIVWTIGKNDLPAPYRNVKTLLDIHGHDGRTTIEWVDPEVTL